MEQNIPVIYKLLRQNTTLRIRSCRYGTKKSWQLVSYSVSTLYVQMYMNRLHSIVIRYVCCESILVERTACLVAVSTASVRCLGACVNV